MFGAQGGDMRQVECLVPRVETWGKCECLVPRVETRGKSECLVPRVETWGEQLHKHII